jgi:hypothetical protein
VLGWRFGLQFGLFRTGLARFLEVREFTHRLYEGALQAGPALRKLGNQSHLIFGANSLRVDRPFASFQAREFPMGDAISSTRICSARVWG